MNASAALAEKIHGQQTLLLVDDSPINLALLRETLDGLGAVDYIAKPFRLEEVIARVNTHLTIDQLKKKLQKQRDELERVLQQVAETQHSLLLKKLPNIPGLRLAVSYETSRYAGGDLYDVLPGWLNRGLCNVSGARAICSHCSIIPEAE